uniref:Uncharacterized protein n=1 Tax=viral metagenome TaxID=1070528 RepID=A0A6C0D7Z5_9ZZZZ
MAQLVKELHQGMLDGQFWGNIILDAETEAFEKMSSAEKAALAAKKTLEEVERNKNVIDYKVNLRKKLYTSADGVAKRKFNRMCKKERYDGGCYLHNEKHGSCSFVHKDERSHYEEVFASFGIKMVDDAAYITLLKKADAATADVKWKMEKDCDAMEMTLKKEARCIFVTGVDATSNLTFAKMNPEYSDTRSSHSNGSQPNSARGNGFRNKPLQQNPRFLNQKTDNSAW